MKNIKQFYVDQDNAMFITSTGSLVVPPISIFRGTEYIFQLTVYDNYSNGTAFNLTSATGFKAYLGLSYGISASPLISSTNFNELSDWSQASLSAGKICFKLNTESDNLYYDLSGAANKDYKIEIWYQNYFSTPSILIQSPITVRNIAATSTGGV